jgi:tRNA(adenine34) deaminase
MEKDLFFMGEALKEAKKALKRGEVPVGAALVHRGTVVARGHNKKETGNDPTAHAEIDVLRKAAKKMKSWRLTGTTLYVTLEPCLMCMGAIIQARIDRVVFATFDPKAGACGSLYDISKDLRLNHRVEITSGVEEEAAGGLLKSFFSELRKKRKESKGASGSSRAA